MIHPLIHEVGHIQLQHPGNTTRLWAAFTARFAVVQHDDGTIYIFGDIQRSDSNPVLRDLIPVHTAAVGLVQCRYVRHAQPGGGGIEQLNRQQRGMVYTTRHTTD